MSGGVLSKRGTGSTGGVARRLWEAFFSLYLAMVTVSILFTLSSEAAAPFLRTETAINRSLEIRQTDFIRGYIQLWVPTSVVALILWAILRTSSRTRLATEFLRFAAGLLTLLSPPIFWTISDWSSGGRLSMPKTSAVESAAAFLFAVAFLRSKGWPWWLVALVCGTHYLFWYFAGESRLEAVGFIGPTGSLLGLCSSVAWCFYVLSLRKDRVSAG